MTNDGRTLFDEALALIEQQKEQITTILQDIVALRTQLAVLLEEKVEREKLNVAQPALKVEFAYPSWALTAGSAISYVNTTTDLTNEPAKIAFSSVINTTSSRQTDETGKR